MKITMIPAKDVAVLKAARAILKNLQKRDNALNKKFRLDEESYETYERFLDELDSLGIEVFDSGEIKLSAD